MDAPAIQETIGGFMSRTFLFEFGVHADPDTDLFEAGLVDSYGFIELVAFLEETYGVTLSDDDLASPEIATLRGISGLIAGRTRR
jgi:acyl carrier protein